MGGGRLTPGGRKLPGPGPAGGGLPAGPPLGGPGDGGAHLPPRGGMDRPLPLPARLCGGGPGPVPPPAGPEAPRLCQPGRHTHRSGDPVLLAGAHPAGRRLSVSPPGPLPLRRGGGLRRGHRLRRRGRHPGGGSGGVKLEGTPPDSRRGSLIAHGCGC